MYKDKVINTQKFPRQPPEPHLQTKQVTNKEQQIFKESKLKLRNPEEQQRSSSINQKYSGGKKREKRKEKNLISITTN